MPLKPQPLGQFVVNSAAPSPPASAPWPSAPPASAPWPPAPAPWPSAPPASAPWPSAPPSPPASAASPPPVVPGLRRGGPPAVLRSPRGREGREGVQSRPDPPGGNGNSGVLTALLIVLLVVAILYLATQYQDGRSLGNALASCGWVLYTIPGCTYCTKQMDALGEASYPKQVVCVGGAASASATMSDSQGPYFCKNVPAFPFWVNEYTSATRTGLQDRKQLCQMLRSPDS